MTKRVIGLQFYNKARKQLQKNPKPYTYQFDLTSETPQPRKFRILLGRFVEVLKEGMRPEYLEDEDQERQNYWDQLEGRLSDRMQMMFLSKKVYEVKEKKLRILFALLLHNRRLFDTLDFIIRELKYLYLDPEGKYQRLSKDLECVQFLRTADILVETNYVHEFVRFKEDILQEELFRRKDAEKVLKDIVDRVDQVIAEEERAKQQARRLKEQKQRLQQERYDEKRQHFLNKGENSTPKPGDGQHRTPDKRVSYDMMRTPKNYDPLATKPRHMKNSEYLFLRKFKHQIEIFEFEPAPVASQRRQKCYECETQLSEGFLFIGSNMNYCEYTGEWFCNKHFSYERIQLPYKVMGSFDLKGYNVSLRAYSEIKSYYSKPLLRIDPYSDLVKTHKNLYEFLVLKRQVHLMYDAICDPQLMEKVFQGRINYCLKDNYLSLKNMYDIYNGHETPQLQGCLIGGKCKCELA